jgi:hypothetical protein
MQHAGERRDCDQKNSFSDNAFDIHDTRFLRDKIIR